MKQKVKEHNERFVSDREGFLQTIGYGDYGSILQSDAMVSEVIQFGYVFAFAAKSRMLYYKSKREWKGDFK
jgi:hypothetical protein